MSIHWTRDALADLDRLHDYLIKYGEDIADRAIFRIIDRTEVLSDHPEIGRRYKDSPIYRELIIPFGKRAYIARYYLADGTAVVTRIWHGLEDRR